MALGGSLLITKSCNCIEILLDVELNILVTLLLYESNSVFMRGGGSLCLKIIKCYNRLEFLKLKTLSLERTSINTSFQLRGLRSKGQTKGMTGEGDLGLTGGPQTYWLEESSQLKCHVGVTLSSSSIFPVGSHSGTFIVLAMAIRSDFNKTFRRIARLFYWFPKSLTCSKNRKSKLVWSQGSGKLSQANASFQILFFFSCY